jgi:hypothetical protein
VHERFFSNYEKLCVLRGRKTPTQRSLRSSVLSVLRLLQGGGGWTLTTGAAVVDMRIPVALVGRAAFSTTADAMARFICQDIQ